MFNRFLNKVVAVVKWPLSLLAFGLLVLAVAGCQGATPRSRTTPLPPTTVSSAALPTLTLGKPSMTAPATFTPQATVSPGDFRFVTQMGRGRISDIAWSPDGQYLAIGGGRKVYLFKKSDGSSVNQIRASSGIVALAMSKNNRIAAALEDGKVVVWRAADGKEIWSADSGESDPDDVALSPQGDFVAIAGWQGTYLWNLTSNKRLQLEKGEQVRSLAFSPDGKLLAGGVDTGAAVVWKTENGALEKRIKGLEDELDYHGIGTVAFSPDNRLLALGSFDSTVGLWNVNTGKLEKSFMPEQWAPAYRVYFSPDGKMIAEATAINFSIWDVESQALIHTLPYASAYLSSDWRVVAFPNKGKVVVRQIFDGEKEYTLDGFLGRVESVTFSPDGKWVVASTDDDLAAVWLVGNPTPQKVLSLELSPAAKQNVMGDSFFNGVPCSDQLNYDHRAAVSKDGTALVVGAANGLVRWWEFGSWKVLHTLRENGGVPLSGLAFTPSGELLLGDQYGASLLEPSDANSKWDLLAGDECVMDMDVSLDGAYVLLAQIAGEASIWKLHGNNPVWSGTFGEDDLTSASFSSQGGWFAVGSETGTVDLMRFSNGQVAQEKEFHVDGEVKSLTFSPDGQLLVAGTSKGNILLWRVPKGTLLTTLGKEGEGSVNSVAFSPDGRMLAAGSADGTVCLWSAP